MKMPRKLSRTTKRKKKARMRLYFSARERMGGGVWRKAVKEQTYLATVEMIKDLKEQWYDTDQAANCQPAP